MRQLEPGGARQRCVSAVPEGRAAVYDGAMEGFDIRRVTGSLGAVVTGLDLKQPLS